MSGMLLAHCYDNDMDLGIPMWGNVIFDIAATVGFAGFLLLLLASCLKTSEKTWRHMFNWGRMMTIIGLLLMILLCMLIPFAIK